MSKKVLVVDDDEALLEITASQLKKFGYDVVLQRSGFGVLSALREEKSDLVLLDVNMPGLSGEAVADLLRSRHPARSFKCLFYSSNDEDTLRDAARRYGFDGYISKGESPLAFSLKVQKYMLDRSYVKA